jgi:hypothetical protein
VFVSKQLIAGRSAQITLASDHLISTRIGEYCNPLSMSYRDLQNKLHDQPFKPFRIRMVNNTVYDIREPWMLTVGELSAIIVTQTRKDDRDYEVALDWRTVSIPHVIEFSDLDSKPNGSNRRK